MQWHVWTVWTQDTTYTWPQATVTKPAPSRASFRMHTASWKFQRIHADASGGTLSGLGARSSLCNLAISDVYNPVRNVDAFVLGPFTRVRQSISTSRPFEAPFPRRNKIDRQSPLAFVQHCQCPSLRRRSTASIELWLFLVSAGSLWSLYMHIAPSPWRLRIQVSDYYPRCDALHWQNWQASDSSGNRLARELLPNHFNIKSRVLYCSPIALKNFWYFSSLISSDFERA